VAASLRRRAVKPLFVLSGCLTHRLAAYTNLTIASLSMKLTLERAKSEEMVGQRL
jgi:hypothetical protein